MPRSDSKINYFPAETILHLWNIIKIQTDNFVTCLDGAQKAQVGFLDCVFTQKALEAACKLNLVRTAERRSTKIVGFAVGIPASVASKIDYFRYIIPELAPHFTYYCFGQLCVDQSNRKKGVGHQLLRQLEYEARRQLFQALIIVNPCGNHVGTSFLQKEKFIPANTPLLTEHVLYYKKL